jgi:NAD(P)-dependent dehydrogenase (short-subunit alcohol dehydrogenase family)
MTTALEPELTTYRWSSDDPADRFPAEDPATGEVITLVQGGGAAEVNAYRASKMGVIGLTRALSATLGDDGITINAVLPSLTRTAMTENLPAAVVSASLGRQVIHRMAEPGDIAGSVLILAAEDAGWITGQTIMANGGNSFGL